MLGKFDFFTVTPELDIESTVDNEIYFKKMPTQTKILKG